MTAAAGTRLFAKAFFCCPVLGPLNDISPKEVTMIRTYVAPALVGAFVLGLATAALAVTGEFDNLCSQGLAQGQKVETDCSVNAQIGGKTYCFGSEEAKATFMKDPEGNLAKAEANYSSMKKG